MSYPDEPLPPIELGLDGLLQRARILLQNGRTEEFISLILAGRCAGEGDFDAEEEGNSDSEDGAGEHQTHRVFVNALSGLPAPNPRNLRLTGDFDSLIGFSRRLLVTVPLSVTPVPSFKYTLKKDLHLTVCIEHQDENGKVIKTYSPHKLANACFATFGVRSQVYLLFPGIVSNGTGRPAMTQADLKTLYDAGIREAVKEVVPEHLAHWPNSYEAAMRLYRDNGGQFHFGSVDIPADKVRPFGRALRRALKTHPRLASPVFMIQLRGTKGMYSFRFDDEVDRARAYNSMVKSVELGQGDTAHWYIDIGVEVSQEGHVLQWISPAHHRLLAHALPTTNESNLSAIRNSTGFCTDLSGHLYDLAGFRVAPGSRGRQDNVQYINVYTTDKAVTYQLHQGSFTHHQATDLFPLRLERVLQDLNDIAQTFSECAGSKGMSQDGTARFEVRVGIAEALRALPTMPDELLIRSLLCIPNALWWDFKYCRIAAVHLVLRDMLKEPARARAEVPSLQLGAALLYVSNAVTSRPRDWSGDVALADSSGMMAPPNLDIAGYGAELEDWDDWDDPVPAHHRRGLYFLCDLLRDENYQWWRLPISHEMDRRLLWSLYGSTCLADIENKMGVTGRLTTRKGTHASRLPNRRKYTLEIEYLLPEAIVPLGLGLNNKGLKIQPPRVPAGRDVREAGLDIDTLQVDNGVLTKNMDFDAFVEQLWAQFAFDIMQLAPNRKSRSDPSYTMLSLDELNKVTVQLFKAPIIPLSSIHHRFLSEEEWDGQFKHYFPEHGDQLAEKIQNFSKCTYFARWKTLRENMSKVHFKVVRAAIRPLFFDLAWLPYSSNDRLWDTRDPTSHLADWTFLTREPALGKSGVRVALHRHKVPAKAAILLEKRMVPQGDAVEEGEEGEGEEEEEGREEEGGGEDIDPRRLPPAPRSLNPGARGIRWTAAGLHSSGSTSPFPPQSLSSITNHLSVMALREEDEESEDGQ